MASNGKSISELENVQTYMSNDDLALISQKQASGAYASKAVKKEAFEKLTISGERDAQTRSAPSYKLIQFLDSSTSHLGSGYIQQGYLTGGQNTMQMIARKKTSSNDTATDAVLGIVVNPSGTRYGYCTVEDFGVGPQPTSSTGANVYLHGASGSIELRPPQTANHGGYIDFHYNGSNVDYTSRLVEGATDLQLASTDKNVVIKANDSGKQVVLNAAVNNARLATQPTSNDSQTSALAIATLGWVADQRYISTVDDLWTERLDLIDSMLSESDQVLYVSASGQDTIDGKPNPGTVRSKPLKTFSAAVNRANKRRFIGNSQCRIHLISNYTFSLNSDKTEFLNRVEFYHPDLNGNKYFHIYGEASNNMATINIDYTGAGRKYYVNAIYANCGVTLHNLTIKSTFGNVSKDRLTSSLYQHHESYENKIPAGGTNDLSLMETYADKIQFIYDATRAATAITSRTSGSIVLDNVTVDGFRWGFVGGGTVGNTTFNNCTKCITPTTGGTVSFKTNTLVKETGVCDKFISQTNSNTTIDLKYDTQFDVLSCYNFIENSTNGVIHYYINDSNMRSYVDNPDNKYGLVIHNIARRTESSESDSSVNPKTSHIVQDTDSTTAKETKVKGFIEDVFGSKINTVMTVSNTIQPAYAGSDRAYEYSIGPATYILEYPPTSWVDYLVTMFRLDQSV